VKRALMVSGRSASFFVFVFFMRTGSAADVPARSRKKCGAAGRRKTDRLDAMSGAPTR
jgi:hypothetical protein